MQAQSQSQIHIPRNFSVRYRHSALSAGQQRTWQRLWPALGLDLEPCPRPGLRPDTSDSVSAQRQSIDPVTDLIDTRRWFGRSAPLVLEIGCGAGISTAAMAHDEPGIDVIAVEVYQRGLAQLMCFLERDGIGNVRLVRGDGIDALQRIASESLAGARVFFPDPWPKVRHHKRRLLQPETVAMIADRLVPGGVLHAATDHAGYAEWIAEVGDAEPGLRRVRPGETLPISTARPTTKYEAKAREARRSISELLWTRPSRPR